MGEKEEAAGQMLLLKPEASGDDLVLTIRPTPRGRDRYGRSPLYRMKGLLKTMGRRFGWRCVSLRPKWVEEEMEKQ